MQKECKQRQTLFSWAPKSLQMVTAAMKEHLFFGRKAMAKLESILKSRDMTLPTNVHLVKAMDFPIVMYGCESWTIKKADYQCFQTMVLEKTPESPLDSKEIKPVNPKENRSTDAKAEAPILVYLI